LIGFQSRLWSLSVWRPEVRYILSSYCCKVRAHLPAWPCHRFPGHDHSIWVIRSINCWGYHLWVYTYSVLRSISCLDSFLLI
jgi:hypothetical protein